MTRAGIRDRHAMWAMRKNPADLTGEQRTSLAAIADTNAALYRSYLLKEQLREVFRAKGATGPAVTGRVAVVGVALAHPRVRDPGSHHPPLPQPDLEHLDHGLSNAKSEATNTHLRALTKRAYGFHSPDALIAMAMLTRAVSAQHYQDGNDPLQRQ